MRSSLVVLALGAIACRSTPAGPAWPRSAGVTIDADDDDGGESLAPRQSAHPAAAIEVADDPTAWEPTADEPAAQLPDVEVPGPDPGDLLDEMIELEAETIIIDDSGAGDDDGP
ncbi:MAG: hypothetical protein R3B06_24430 [Kofleriaceae bacterium]